MKIKEGFVMRDMGDQTVVVPTGKASREFNGMVKLNETGKLLWTQIEKGAGRDELIDTLIDKYDVQKDQAAGDVDAFLKSLTGPGIIEE